MLPLYIDASLMIVHRPSLSFDAMTVIMEGPGQTLVEVSALMNVWLSLVGLGP